MQELRDWWLNIAQSLPVGGVRRCAHPLDNKARPSVTVRNTPLGYSVRCYRRNQSDFVPKQHAGILDTVHTDMDSVEYPDDTVKLTDADSATHARVEAFLLTKNVSSIMFPKGVLGYSQKAGRLVVDVSGYSLGRDLTGRSNTKWINYTPITVQRSNSCVLHGNREGLVIVEDILSAVKIVWSAGVSAVALLGTKLHDTHRLLIQNRADVHVCLDGDLAGMSAQYRLLPDLKSLGTEFTLHWLPMNKDPKDLSIQELRDMFRS